jgi:hypothetical protein
LQILPPISLCARCLAVIRVTLAQWTVVAENSFPVSRRMEKGSPAPAANMDFHFIDFAWRRSE